MTFEIKGELLETILDTLAAATQELANCRKREIELRSELENNRLLSIKQACEYLGGINEDTLLYYRRYGLDYYKKARVGVWYKKGDIDVWLAKGKVSRHSK